MPNSLFEMSDDELEAVRRQRIFDRSRVLAQGYKRPAQAQAGAMLGGALAKTIFGLKSPEESELAKRAAFQKYMQSTGISMAQNPEAYYAAAAQAASKFGMKEVAERATMQLENLKGVRVDRGFKEKGIALQEEGIAVDREQLGETKRANQARELLGRQERTWKPAVDDKVWGPKVGVLPEGLRNLAQVNDLGELDETGKALINAFAGGGARKTPVLKPGEVNVSPEDQLQVTASMLNSPQRIARYEKDGWLDNTGKLSAKGKIEMQAVAQAARQVQINAYANNKDSPAIGVVSDQILRYKEARPQYTYEQIGAWLISQQKAHED